jgi:Ca-activated chloride channel family protein
MRNEIEKFIDKNRYQLDVDVPSDALWGKIEEELEEKKKRRGAIWWWTAAASVLLVVGTFLFWPTKNLTNQQITYRQKEEQLILKDTTDVSTSKKEAIVKNKRRIKISHTVATALEPSEIIVEESATQVSTIEKNDVDEKKVVSVRQKSEIVISSISAETMKKTADVNIQSIIVRRVSGKKSNLLTGKFKQKQSIEHAKKVQLSSTNYKKQKRKFFVADTIEVHDENSEQYDEIVENEWQNPQKEPLSTFSVDVDAAGYSNVRRFLNNDQLPPKNAVKIEEMVNYFGYSYPKPTGEHPLSITTEYGACPWNSKHKLVHIGLKAKDIEKQNIPASNLVFLIDVSGSMQAADKLELLKKGFTLLTSQLREQDRVSIVVYAGASGVVLPPTKGNDKATILAAIDRLSAGGSTAGAQGIELAYQVAAENYKKEGNNRIILATDGDFNVGISADNQLVKLIEEKRKSGVFLTVLGFGEGNLQAEKMEKLADNGNGNYAYVDNLMEAKKVLVNEFGALYTVAKDVKLQVEFNPAKVKAYRLLGYENRMLRTQDFDNDTIDAGEMGAGHTVTALYEIIPADSDEKVFDSPDLRYQKTDSVKFTNNNELMYIKFRYKDPEGTQSKLLKHVVYDATSTLTENFYFSAAVAEFGLLIRESKFKGNASFQSIENNATKGFGIDKEGYRHEFLMLVRKAQLLMKK